MRKTIDIAGIRLDNYSVQEALELLDRQMSDRGLRMIEEVNTDTLMLASSDEAVKTALESMDLTLVSETAILDAAGVSNYQKRREIEHHDFFYELMRRVEHRGGKICVIGDTEERTQTALEDLFERFPQCEGISCALELFEGAEDSAINEINVVTPDVILCILPSPMQERFLLEHKDKLSTKLWYGVGRMPLKETRRGILGMLHRMIRVRRLEKHIHNVRQGRVGDEQS